MSDAFRGHEVVRPYVMTGGRTRVARRDLRLETMLTTVSDPVSSDGPSDGPSDGRSDDRSDDAREGTEGLTAEQVGLLRCCRTPMALAEASATLGLVVSVTAILAADLVADGLLEVHQTDPVEIELDALNRMIEAVRTL